MVHAFKLIEFVPAYTNTYANLGQLESYLQNQNVLSQDQMRLEEKQGVHTQSHSLKGEPGRCFVETGETFSCDPIVTDSQQHGTVKYILLSSMSNYLLHHRVCPVLMIPTY